MKQIETIKGGENVTNTSGVIRFAVGSFIVSDGVKYRTIREFDVVTEDGSITDWDKVRENTVPDYTPEYPVSYYQRKKK